ncbi:hypothetical protein JMF94_07900 [Desulfovibrio sp. UIB00]|uniref:DUF1466 family protein n=1 Tax=Desulfovibrio sp. UIB00 TaxID=2804314 RepID=UPI001F0F118D|nr:DUF1466 family protein [Desulfovibrio sp. UIB00]MCH5145006.1 hypothetical protein [Desulfovibrio sp. UIB00]
MARHQIGQIVDHPAGLRQQVRYVFIPNAKAVNFKADFMGHPNGIVCGQMVVWHANNLNHLSLLFDRQHGLQKPPQSPSQRCSSRSPNVEQVWHRLPVPHDGEYGIGRRSSREGRYRRVYSTEMPQCGCHCKAGSFGEVNWCASHAATYLQQDMDSGVKPL